MKKLTKIKNKLRGEANPFESSLRVIEVIAIVLASGGLIYGILQVNATFQNLKYTSEQLNQIKNLDSANMMFTFDNKLYTGKNYEIFLTIDDNQPILIENGGKFTSTQLNDYLGVFNELEDIREENLIDDVLLYDSFADATIKTWNSKEIREYLKKARTVNSEYFGGFDLLVKYIQSFQ